MKSRIINNEFAGIYSNEWLEKNKNVIINGALVAEWELVNSLPNDYLLKPIWNVSEFIEGATQQEIKETQTKKYLEEETKRYEKRTADGQQAYAKISAEFRLAKLAGIVTEESHGIIEKLLIPVRNEILAGQWKSGLIELESLGSEIIGINLYNRLHTQINDYITISYPS